MLTSVSFVLRKQAHALTPLLTSPPPSVPTFPFLTLLVSGGHTLLLLASSIRRFKILATTRDEAVGRTIDKVARDLHLKWDGRAPGAALEAFCRNGLADSVDKSEQLPAIQPFKIPLKGELAFSFSGLHSSVDRYIEMHEWPHRLQMIRRDSRSFSPMRTDLQSRVHFRKPLLHNWRKRSS